MSRTIFALSSLALAMGISSLAQAGGFQVSELSVREQGYRNAGSAVAATSASTVHFNPAGLALIEKETIELGAHMIMPSFEFTDTGSTNAIGGPATGRSSAEGGDFALVPNNYMAMPLGNGMTFGLGITAPYGLVTEYDSDWVGRYNALVSDVLTIDVNPAMGFRINDQLALGAGVSLQYVDVKLTNALDFGTAGFLAGVPGFEPSSAQFDGWSRVSGHNYAFGFNLGAMYQISDSTRMGLGYRSSVEQEVKGAQEVVAPDSVALLGITSFVRDAEATVEMPASAQIGLSHQLDDQLTLFADAQWTDWSTFDELRIKLAGSADAVQPENWEDSWRYSLGLSYRYDDQWTFRTGIQYDETPIPDEYRTPRIPGDDRFWTAVGLSYQPTPNISVDLAYTHVFLGNYSINDTETTSASLTGVPVGSTLKGDYDAAADIVSLQVQMLID